ncbi:MAG: hypothetical protein WCR06_12005, partial [bacterium]
AGYGHPVLLPGTGREPRRQDAERSGVGSHELVFAPLDTDTRYCFRVLAENRGGKTLSDPVWVRTGKLHPIEKQVGTVVAVK